MIGPEKVVPFVYPACLVFGFIVTWWLLRKVPQRAILHGTLIGVIATAIYVLAGFANPEGIESSIALYGSLGFIVVNALRILGCMAAGYALRARAQ
jgi:hypothetical protein